MEASKPKVIFVGNPGKGKSFLCNGLFRAGGVAQRFKSSVAVDRVTVDMQTGETKDFVVVDVPGLLDVLGDEVARKNKEELKKGLGLSGNYYVVFVVTLEAARIRAEDLAVVTAICEAFDAQEDQLAVVINKVDEDEHEVFRSNTEQYRQYFSRACKKSLQPNRIIALPNEVGRSEISDSSLALLNDMLQKMIPHAVGDVRDIKLDEDEIREAKAQAAAAEAAILALKKVASVFSDAGGWNAPQYFSTMGTCSLDSKLVIAARGSSQIHALVFDPGAARWTARFACDYMKDGGGWGKPQYYSTVRVLEVNNRLCVVGRGSSVIHVAMLDSRNGKWTMNGSCAFMNDAGGWSREEYYSSFRAVSLDRNLCVFGRGTSKLHVAIFDLEKQSWTQNLALEFMADKAGWLAPQYRQTIRVVALGKRLCVFGRGSEHLHVALFDPASGSWTSNVTCKFMNDAGGWAQPQYFSTVRAVALDENRLCVIGRGSFSMHAAIYDAGKDTWTTSLSQQGLMADAGGWNQQQYYSTIQVAALSDGRVAIAGRGSSHVHLVIFHPLTLEWVPAPPFASFGDGGGWNHPQYYSTFRVQAIPDSHKVAIVARGVHKVHVLLYDVKANSWSIGE